jgi:hypothetical protein
MDWESASTTDKEKALIQATRLLDELVSWDGDVSSDTQALRWPRQDVVDKDDNEIDEDTIPDFLKNATAEYAKKLLGGDLTANSDTDGFKRIKVSSIELEIDYNRSVDPIPLSVKNIISQYGSFYSKTYKNIRG